MARVKTGGRQKGTPNKNTQDIQAKLAAIGCDPILGMAEIAAEARSNGNLELAGSMYKELAQYVAPKRKAIEVQGDVGLSGGLHIKWMDDKEPEESEESDDTPD